MASEKGKVESDDRVYVEIIKKGKIKRRSQQQLPECKLWWNFQHIIKSQPKETGEAEIQ